MAWAREYRTKVEGEVQMICNTALGIVDQCLIPKSTGESKAFYLMMKADYYRYIAEFTTGEAKVKAASRAEKAYVVAAAAAAAEDVAVTHPIRLTLALNHSILLHEMQSKPEELTRWRARLLRTPMLSGTMGGTSGARIPRLSCSCCTTT